METFPYRAYNSESGLRFIRNNDKTVTIYLPETKQTWTIQPEEWQAVVAVLAKSEKDLPHFLRMVR